MLLFIFYDYFYLEIELDGLTLSLFFFSHLLYHSYFVAIFFLSLENTKIFLFLEIFNYMHTFFLLANFSTPIRRSKKRNCNITFAIIWNNYSIAAIIIIIINNKKKHQMISLIVFAKFSMGKGNYFFRVKRKCSSSFFFLLHHIFISVFFSSRVHQINIQRAVTILNINLCHLLKVYSIECDSHVRMIHS